MNNYFEHLSPDDISFDRKVQQTPLIVIGISLTKNFHKDIDDLFNITFLVQCILKGKPTEQIIQIVQAGSLLGRHAHQKLDVNREYLVFLEPFFHGTYRPVDFEDIPYSTQIDSLLKKTCGLSRSYPFTEGNDTEAALINKCPSAVSVNCQSDIKKTTTVSVAASVIPTLIEQDPLELEALSLLFADRSSKQKSRFSDDQIRNNNTNHLSFTFLLNIILFSILYIIM
ncbi:hypothetical protein I4U23_017997 [Adineta vaga]|nr:hypothetical protein I4U23_017997 [Adineta vaga]